jgi:hypothetical protein
MVYNLRSQVQDRNGITAWQSKNAKTLDKVNVSLKMEAAGVCSRILSSGM